MNTSDTVSYNDLLNVPKWFKLFWKPKVFVSRSLLI